MDQPTSQSPSPATSPDTPLPPSGRPSAPARKRSSSGAGGLLSKLPFMRSAGDHHRPRSRRNTIESDPTVPTPTLPIPSFITIPADDTAPPSPLPHILQQHRTSDPPQQQKTRRRRGSLRKVALLGRGAQRERREGRALSIDTKFDTDSGRDGTCFETIIATNSPITSSPTPIDRRTKVIPILQYNGDDLSKFGLGISDATPRPSMDTPTIHNLDDAAPSPDPDATPIAGPPPIVMRTPSGPAALTASDTSPSINYSTTDDEDALHMARSPASSASLPNPRLITPSLSLSRPERASLSSGSDSYFHSRPVPVGGGPTTTNANGVGDSALQRRRSAASQRAKSPLALAPLAAPLSAAPDADWDYAETEWWGWIILAVTWTVFVVGMGSCLGVWSWAWDVGTTPYAPPELEDDPTLPIVGYYPALLILTGVMAWVWVVVAWTGMKYFRHAQVSKD